jgi:hypothetical protein
MIHETSNPAFAGSINDVLFIYPEEVARAFVLKFSPGLIFIFPFISHA